MNNNDDKNFLKDYNAPYQVYKAFKPEDGTRYDAEEWRKAFPPKRVRWLGVAAYIAVAFVLLLLGSFDGKVLGVGSFVFSVLALVWLVSLPVLSWRYRDREDLRPYLLWYGDRERNAKARAYNVFLEAMYDYGLLSSTSKPEWYSLECVCAGEPDIFIFTCREHTYEGLERFFASLVPKFDADRVEVDRIDNTIYKLIFRKTGVATTLNETYLWNTLAAPVDAKLDAIPVGVNEAGELVNVGVVDDESGDSLSCLIAGIPRSGKSSMLYSLTAGLCKVHYERGDGEASPNEMVIIFDPKATDFTPFKSRCEVISDIDEMSIWLNELNDEMFRRLRFLTRNNKQKFSAIRKGKEDKERFAHFSPDFPHITLIVDEYATIFSSARKTDKEAYSEERERENLLLSLVRTAPSVGISVVVANHRMSSTVIPTDVRDMFTGWRTAFRVGKQADVDLCFYDGAWETIRAYEIPPKSRGLAYMRDLDGKEFAYKALLLKPKVCQLVAESTKDYKPEPKWAVELKNAISEAREGE